MHTCVGLTCSGVGDPTGAVHVAVERAGVHGVPHEGVHTVLDRRDEDGPGVLGEGQRASASE